MEFTLGKIVWAKLRGYPWWPAQIDSVNEKVKDKKYYIKFIGDFTSAHVSVENLCLFEEGITKNYHISKKKTLLNAFKEAKEQFKTKEGKATTSKLDKIISKSNKAQISEEAKEQESSASESESKNKIKEDKRKDTVNKNKADEKPNNINTSESNFLKSKRKRDTVVLVEPGSLIEKITNYLKHISENLSSSEYEVSEKETLNRVFTYLNKYKMENAIEILKQTQLGIIVRYLSINFQDSELKEISSKVNSNFEEQVLHQMFSKK